MAVGSGGCNSWLVLQEDRGTLLSSWGGDRASSEGLNLLWCWGEGLQAARATVPMGPQCPRFMGHTKRGKTPLGMRSQGHGHELLAQAGSRQTRGDPHPQSPPGLDLVSGWGCCQWEALCLLLLLYPYQDQETGSTGDCAAHFWVEKPQDSQCGARAVPHGHLWQPCVPHYLSGYKGELMGMALLELLLTG